MMVPKDFDERIAALAREDEAYMALLQECMAVEPAFLALYQRLSEEEQELLDCYTSCCENMLYRQAQLAAGYYAIHGARVLEQR